MSYPITPADWDSRFFGFPVGNIELPADYSKDLLAETLRNAHDKFRFLTVTLCDNGPAELPLDSALCPCYDRKLTYKKDVPTNVSPLASCVRSYTSTFCSPSLERLAVQSGTMTRFRRDPELSPQFERLYLTWINLAVTKELADSIWTWYENGQHLGLVTVRCAKRTNPKTGQLEREGRIGMLAVDSHHRRRGIGARLFGACDFWCSSLNVPVNAIVTQKDNDAAIAICEKLGFRRDSESSVYHYWSPGWIYDAHRGWYCRVG